ncbi:MAG TPA: YaaR family protein [Bacillota bacterium]|nr:YaaR family protein [Bacillota bacterium]
MEIKPTGTKALEPKSDSAAPKAAGTSPSRSTFFGTFREADQTQRKLVCDKLLQQIDVQSEELKKGITPQGIKEYRKLVAAFLKEALHESYEIDQETHWDRRGNRKVFTMVKRVNQALEELTDSVMDREKKQIDIVAKLDEIRGMLLDLYL